MHRCGGVKGGQDGNPGCGELIHFDENGMIAVEAGEVGEFWIEEQADSAIMHAQCGLNHNLPLA